MQFYRMQRLTEAASSQLAIGGSPFYWERIKADIAANRAQLFETENGSYIVLSVQKPDLVVLACTGENGKAIMKECIAIAKLNDCEFVRFITKHKGLPRLLKEFEPQDFGTIYRIKAYESND
jgi:predicted acetyltransferase